MKYSVAKKNNITWFEGYISRENREELHGHKGAVIWFTGLSASGKSTIAHHLERMLFDIDCSTYVFDGDNVRHGLCSDLGFSEEHRTENIRRIGEMVKLFIDAGIIAITAFISPFRKDREKVRDLVGREKFIEVYVKCPLHVCATRDLKGIYKRAEQGIIQNFTGISAPYEPPENPDLVIQSDEIEATIAANQVVDLIRRYKII